MPTITDSGLVQARLRSVYAHGRVEDVLLGVALDVIEPFASEYMSGDEYIRLRSLVQRSADAAAEAALATMANELALVAEANPDIRRRLQRAHVRS